jgi:uncharacterized protein DUF4154
MPPTFAQRKRHQKKIYNITKLVMKKTLVAIIIAAVAFTTSVSAQTSLTKVQSLYMYNFIKNIQWNNVNDTYVVGVYANDAVVKEISAVLGVRKFNGKSIVVKKIASPSQASNCHLVYVSTGNSAAIKRIKESANLKNTLVVSEKGQLNNGAAIAFVLENSKLKFKINESACNASGLQVSKGLISLGV